MLSYTRARLTPGFREETSSRSVHLREAFAIHVEPGSTPCTDDPVLITDTSLSYHIRYPGYTIIDKVTFQADTPEELHPLVAAVGYAAHLNQQWGLLGALTDIVAGTPWRIDTVITDKLHNLPINVVIALSVVHIGDLVIGIDGCGYKTAQLHHLVSDLVAVGNDPDARLAFCELVDVM